MLTRKNVKNGDDISILGFGAMRLPNGNQAQELESIRLIRKAIHDGVNYFDTAYIYQNGKNEILLGKALSGGYRERVKIATKLPPFLVKKLETAKKIFETQLASLQTDYIDYYLVHMLTDKAGYERMADMGVISWLEDLKKEGKIVNLGFSFHGSKEDFVEILTAYPWDFCQIQYNYFDENNQAGKSGLELAAGMGIPVIVMEPLRGGNLVNKLPKEVENIFKECHSDWTPAEWGLRWVWNHPEVMTVLSGMSDESQIIDNIRIAADAEAGSLSKKELLVFDEVKAMLSKRIKVPCTGCGYCMPCPYGVNIPGCFSNYNDKYLMNLKTYRFKYAQTLGALSKKPAMASACKDCGKCEALCPQQINIRNELKNVRKKMEGPLFKPVVWAARKFMRIK